MRRNAPLDRFLAAWPPGLAEQFLVYDETLRRKSCTRLVSWGEAESSPYWKQLPRWTAEGNLMPGGGAWADFLQKTVWGQTCLFYAIRLQDDLLDGQIGRSPLVIAPLLFLTEAERVFSSIMGPSPAFWKHYRQAVNTTLAGVVRVSELQRNPLARADELLEAYATVDAIFSIGSAAVCVQMGKAARIRRVSRFVSELGKVLLALDDVADIDEDLADGRFNYPAKVLLARQGIKNIDAAQFRKTWPSAAKGGGFDEIRTALEGCLMRASAAIAPLRLEPAQDLIERTRESLQGLGADF